MQDVVVHCLNARVYSARPIYVKEEDIVMTQQLEAKEETDVRRCTACSVSPLVSQLHL